MLKKDAEQSWCQGTTLFHAVSDGKGFREVAVQCDLSALVFVQLSDHAEEFGGQPRRSKISQSPFLLTVSNRVPSCSEIYFLDKAHVNKMKLNWIFPHRLDLIVTYTLMYFKKRLQVAALEWLNQGFQPFSYHVPLQHSDRWPCTPTYSISTDEHVPLKFLKTKYFIMIIHRYI